MWPSQIRDTAGVVIGDTHWCIVSTSGRKMMSLAFGVNHDVAFIIIITLSLGLNI